MADLTLKRWDTFPPLNVTLSDQNGFINLAGASQVKLLMKGTNVLVSGVMTIASAAGGNVTYQWQHADLSVADIYQAEYEIAWTAGGIETVPSNGYNTIVVLADLENA